MFGKAKIGKRDTRITVLSPNNPNGVQGYYDANGEEIISTNTTTELWAEVMDRAKIGAIIGGRIQNDIELGLVIDSRSASVINLDDTITLDTGTETFQVVDKHDSAYKYTSMVLVRRSS